MIWKRKCYYNVASECSSEVEIKCILIKVHGVVSVIENWNITVQRHVGATYIDVAFPYKQAIAITNAYGLIDPTTTNVASQSLLYPRGKSQRSITWW